MAISEILSTSNPLLQTYVFYSSLLVFKMMAMSILTAIQRVTNKSYSNPEDASFNKGKVQTNEKVERVRRAHLNDIENIPIFLTVSFFYILTNPSVTVASWLFRIFTVARYMHTVVYAIHVVRQPSRAALFTIGVLTTTYMTVQSLFHFM